MTKRAKCAQRGCSRIARARGFCGPHYMAWYHSVGNDPNGVRSERGCAVGGCEKMHHAHGYCRTHARHFMLHGDPLKGGPRPRSVCKVKGCRAWCQGCGYCSKHYGRFYRWGDPLGGFARRGAQVRWPQIPKRVRALATGYDVSLKKGLQPTAEQRAGVNEYQRRLRVLKKKLTAPSA